MSDQKGRVQVKGGRASKNEAEVVDGAVKLIITNQRGLEGYGTAQIKGGVPEHGEAQVTDGAIHIVLS